MKSSKFANLLLSTGVLLSLAAVGFTDSIDPKPVVEAAGWTMRLFQLR